MNLVWAEGCAAAQGSAHAKALPRGKPTAESREPHHGGSANVARRPLQRWRRRALPAPSKFQFGPTGKRHLLTFFFFCSETWCPRVMPCSCLRANKWLECTLLVCRLGCSACPLPMATALPTTLETMVVCDVLAYRVLVARPVWIWPGRILHASEPPRGLTQLYPFLLARVQDPQVMAAQTQWFSQGCKGLRLPWWSKLLVQCHTAP